MAEVQCQVEIPKESGDGASLTVGQVFYLNCEGPWPKMNPDTIELRLDKENDYKLKLLKFSFTSPTQAQLVVTSYKTGQHQLKALQVVEGDQSVVLGDVSFTVQSLMNPQEPVKEPYGPVGPLGLRLPIWYPLTLVLIIAGIVVFVFYRLRLRRQKKKLLQDMRLNEYAKDPFFQFYQSARKMQRSFGFFSGGAMAPGDGTRFIGELDTAFKIYLARKFEVPTLAWSERRILADLKKNFPEFYKEFRLPVRQALAELSRALKAGATITSQDCQQLFELLRKQIDQIENWTQAQKAKKGST